MKVLRTHDYLPQAPMPNVSGLHRIMAALFAAMVFCLVVCTVLIIRDTGVHPKGEGCACAGRCTG
jgi:predicted benzoate:H+ symporter BenE